MSLRDSIHLPEWRTRRGRADPGGRGGRGGRAEQAWRRALAEDTADAVRRVRDETPPARQQIW